MQTERHNSNTTAIQIDNGELSTLVSALEAYIDNLQLSLKVEEDEDAQMETQVEMDVASAMLADLAQHERA